MIVALAVVGYLICGVFVAAYTVYHDGSWDVDDDSGPLAMLMVLWPILLPILLAENFLEWVAERGKARRQRIQQEQEEQARLMAIVERELE